MIMRGNPKRPKGTKGCYREVKARITAVINNNVHVVLLEDDPHSLYDYLRKAGDVGTWSLPMMRVTERPNESEKVPFTSQLQSSVPCRARSSRAPAGRADPVPRNDLVTRDQEKDRARFRSEPDEVCWC